MSREGLILGLFLSVVIFIGCARTDDNKSELCRNLERLERELQDKPWHELFKWARDKCAMDNSPQAHAYATLAETLARAKIRSTDPAFARLPQSGWVVTNGFLMSSPKKIGDVIIPGEVDGQRVVVIPYSFFEETPCVTSVEISEGVERIGECAFYKCAMRGLKTPSTLKRIQRGAFCDCWTLRSIEFSEGLEEIGEGCFRHCHSLEKIVLPSTLKKLGKNCFADCPNLKEIRYRDGRVLKMEK